MKKSSTVFLQGVIVLIGVVVLAVMIRFPMTEGRAANLDLFSIYADPFILYGYLASIPFFVGLYQAFKLLKYIGQNQVFSVQSIRALRMIKYCAVIVGAAIILAAIYIRLSFDGTGEEDPAGFVAISIVATFAAIVVATTAAVIERVLQNAIDIKSENDLTV
jgi:hypothetical protein